MNEDLIEQLKEEDCFDDTRNIKFNTKQARKKLRKERFLNDQRNHFLNSL